MPRKYGYSQVGELCYDIHDWQAKGRINAIGAIIDFVFVTVSLFEGSINSDTFYAWVTRVYYPNCQIELLLSWLMQHFISVLTY